VPGYAQMLPHHWKLILVRDFLAIMVALAWALLSYAGRWNVEKLCDPTWQGFFLYVVLLVGALAAIELFLWMVSRLYSAYRRVDGQSEEVEGESSIILATSVNFKSWILNFGGGLLLLRLSVYLGGPSPCEPTHPERAIWSYLGGCLASGLGCLCIARGLIREIRRDA
jgi:hypothetical protein